MTGTLPDVITDVEILIGATEWNLTEATARRRAADARRHRRVLRHLRTARRALEVAAEFNEATGDLDPFTDDYAEDPQ